MSTPYPPTTFLRQRDGASAIALTWAEHWELLWDGYKPVNGTPDFPVGEVEQRVPKSVVDAKGDLLVGLAADAVGRLAAGANGRQLFADSAQETGLRWGADGEHVTAANVGAVNVNTLITAGSYYVSSSATNTPTAANGFVRVSRIGVAVSQEFVGVTGTPIATWTRRSVDTGATWTAWVETAAKSAVDAKVSKAGDTMTGNLTIDIPLGGQLGLNSDPGKQAQILLSSKGSARWIIRKTDSAETGGNAGSDFVLSSRADDGTGLPVPLIISRATGSATFSAPVSVATPTGTAHATTKSYVDTADGLKANRAGDTFTGVIQVHTAGTAFRVRRTNGTVDAREWGGYVETDGSLNFSPTADSGAINGARLILDRDGRVRAGGIYYLTGTGFPEGVVAAPVGSRYVDSAATNGAVEWIKASGTGTTGWKVVYGDTGWRNVNASVDAGWRTAANGGASSRVAAVRRIGDRAMLRLLVDRAASGSNYTENQPFLTLPAGFKNTGFTALGSGLAAGNRVAIFSTVGVIGNVIVGCPDTTGSWTAGEYLAAEISFAAEAAWPTSLPGTAA